MKLERVFGSQKPHAMLELVFDASPWGLGGFLTDVATGQILQFFADSLTEQDATRFGKPLGEASGQQCWEALAILVGLRLWAPLIEGKQAILRVKTDSKSAIGVVLKMASSCSVLNGIGAEVVLTLEAHDIQDLVASHIPGILNQTADALSRMAQPGVSAGLPESCKGSRRRVVPVRDDAYFPVWKVSVL